MVIIRDDELLKSASSIGMTLADGSKTRITVDGKGMVIPYDNTGGKSMSRLEILDKENKVINST